MNKDEGWINVYKPINISSFQALNKIKKKFNLLKIGHAGTLDPLAEGILPVAIGKTTKLISFINNDIKEYEFDIKWGEQTSTDDREGRIINLSANIPTLTEIKIELNKHKGKILQKPPQASAVKINGKRAYSLFRNNKNFTIKKKLVHIYEASFIEQVKKEITKIKIICGKGFYIRSFARDIGKNLGTVAHIYSLKRTKVGKFTKENSILLDDLLKIRHRDLGIRGFYSSTSMLDDILAYEIDDKKKLEDISYGRIIKFNEKELSKTLKLNENKLCLLTNKDNIISLGKFEDNYFKPKKVFI